MAIEGHKPPRPRFVKDLIATQSMIDPGEHGPKILGRNQTKHVRPGGSEAGGNTAIDCKAPTAGSFVPCVVLSALAGATMPIWIVPAIIVSLGRSGATQSQIDDEAVATAAELERDAIATRMRETLAAEELVAKLEDGYAQSLRGVLESPTPAAGNTAARARVLSGLSRIAIARSRNGDEWLVVCARASAGIGDQPPRYFESCWSEPVTPDKYGGDADVLRPFSTY